MNIDCLHLWRRAIHTSDQDTQKLRLQNPNCALCLFSLFFYLFVFVTKLEVLFCISLTWLDLRLYWAAPLSWWLSLEACWEECLSHHSSQPAWWYSGHKLASVSRNLFFMLLLLICNCLTSKTNGLDVLQYHTHSKGIINRDTSMYPVRFHHEALHLSMDETTLID